MGGKCESANGQTCASQDECYEGYCNTSATPKTCAVRFSALWVAVLQWFWLHAPACAGWDGMGHGEGRATVHGRAYSADCGCSLPSLVRS